MYVLYYICTLLYVLYYICVFWLVTLDSAFHIKNSEFIYSKNSEYLYVVKKL